MSELFNKLNMYKKKKSHQCKIILFHTVVLQSFFYIYRFKVVAQQLQLGSARAQNPNPPIKNPVTYSLFKPPLPVYPIGRHFETEKRVQIKHWAKPIQP